MQTYDDRDVGDLALEHEVHRLVRKVVAVDCVRDRTASRVSNQHLAQGVVTSGRTGREDLHEGRDRLVDRDELAGRVLRLDDLLPVLVVEAVNVVDVAAERRQEPGPVRNRTVWTESIRSVVHLGWADGLGTHRSPRASASSLLEHTMVSGSDWMMACWKRPWEPLDVRCTETPADQKTDAGFEYHSLASEQDGARASAAHWDLLRPPADCP